MSATVRSLTVVNRHCNKITTARLHVLLCIVVGSLLLLASGSVSAQYTEMALVRDVFKCIELPSGTIYAASRSWIWKSVDDGATWTVVTGGRSREYRDVCFLNDTVGMIVGPCGLSVTTDAFKSSKGISGPAELDRACINLFGQMKSLDSFYVAAYYDGTGGYFATGDGGNTWVKPWWVPALDQRRPLCRTDMDLDGGLYMVTTYTADILPVKGVDIGRTTNAGASWLIYNTWDVDEYGVNFVASSIDYIDSLNGWLGGFRDTANMIATDFEAYGKRLVLSTTDGGVSWNLSTSEFADTVTAISFRDRLNGCAGDASGAVMLSNDGGRTWNNDDVPTKGPVTAVAALKSGTILVFGYDYALRKAAISSVQELSPAIHVHASPNPATDWLELRLDGVADICLMDLLGTMYFNIDDFPGGRLDLHDVPSGTYLLHARQVTQRSTIKIVIQK